MRTRSHTYGLTLTGLPDDAFQQVLDACIDYDDDFVPRFEAVKGLACLSKALLEQLHRLRPLVGFQSLSVLQRLSHGPWRVTLLYKGAITEAVLEQARQGRVLSILSTRAPNLTSAVAQRVVPELLGAGCSLLKFTLTWEGLNGTWAATFGEAAVCSAVLRTLRLQFCGLRGPLPELRLPALQVLSLLSNSLTGGLEPLRSCTGLQVLNLCDNHLTGGLEPLRGCTKLEELNLNGNQHTGGLEPLTNCTALQDVFIVDNKLTGGLDPLKNCTALDMLFLSGNKLTGGLEPLRGCTELMQLRLNDNTLTGSLEPLSSCTELQVLQLDNNQLTGSLEPLRGCEALRLLCLKDNQLSPSDEDKARFKKQCRHPSAESVDFI